MSRMSHFLCGSRRRKLQISSFHLLFFFLFVSWKMDWNEGGSALFSSPASLCCCYCCNRSSLVGWLSRFWANIYALLIKFMDLLQLLGVGGYRLLLMNMCCIVKICGAWYWYKFLKLCVWWCKSFFNLILIDHIVLCNA